MLSIKAFFYKCLVRVNMMKNCVSIFLNRGGKNDNLVISAHFFDEFVKIGPYFDCAFRAALFEMDKCLIKVKNEKIFRGGIECT